jgi:alpha-1,3-rhamnosyltransferase
MSDTRTNPPLVSVIMPAYNHARFVRDAIRSVARQTYPNVELIVLDDGSTDDTGEIARETLREITIPSQFVSKSNEGLCRTLNKGLMMARGEYMAVLASDDMMAPGKIRQEADALRASDADVAGCYGDIEHVDEAGDRLLYACYRPTDDEEDAFLSFLLTRKPLFIQNGLFRTSVVRELGGFDESLRYEDRDFLLRLLRRYKYQYVGGLSVYYRNVQGSLGGQTRFFEDDHFAIMEKHRDAPQLKALGWNAQRKLTALTWLFCARIHFTWRDYANMRRCLRNAVAEWPFSPRIWGWIIASRVPRQLVDAGLKLRVRGHQGKVQRDASSEQSGALAPRIPPPHSPATAGDRE